MIIPKKVSDRLISRLRPFQTILKSASDRDVNESDTVTIVVDMLADLFGFEKYHSLKSCYFRNFIVLAVTQRRMLK